MNADLDTRPIRVLLAEDNFINQKVVVGFCAAKGWDVRVAENGRQAVLALEEGRYDIILMDVQMPEMNGVEATREIRRRSELPQIPIIAVTAHALEGDEERFLAAGMNYFIKKPIDFDLLEKTVLDLVTHVEARPVKTMDRADNAFSQLMHTVGMSKEDLVMLVNDFLGMYRDDMDRLAVALDGGDSKMVSEIAHKLKGAIGNFGAENVRSVFLKMEMAAKGGDVVATGKLLPQLDKEMTVFLETFDKFKG